MGRKLNADLSTTTLCSSEGEDTQGKGLVATKLSLEEAIAKAKTKFPGRVLEAELENEHGQVVYEIEIASATGAVTEIEVDAQSGEILGSELEDEEDIEQEQGEEKDND